MGWTGGDDYALTGERALACGTTNQRQHRRHDLERLGHAPYASLTRLRHLAGVGTYDRHAIRDELHQIAPCCLMLPHAGVHGGRHEDGSVGREQHGAGEVVGVAARQFGHEVGGCGRQHDEIGLAREPNMADVELGLRIE